MFVDGDKLALKTMNPRLGIIGGLSILGTTGIVRPYSCAAWIASIHQGIDVASANGVGHIAATTGNTSEDAIKMHYAMEEMALIEMGDFCRGSPQTSEEGAHRSTEYLRRFRKN